MSPACSETVSCRSSPYPLQMAPQYSMHPLIGPDVPCTPRLLSCSSLPIMVSYPPPTCQLMPPLAHLALCPQEKIKTMFEQLVVVDHPNIVKLHKYWLDVKDSKARVIFITEYVSSGSLKQFLKKTKKNHKAMNARAWKRWCTQILSALSFLHSCDPPIIHGNLTSDTVFIQHNGLIKIGSAIPDDLRSPIRIERDEQRNLHFFPPEYGHVADGTAVDIFSFGMCALEVGARRPHYGLQELPEGLSPLGLGA
uniref:Protein kinase domain-containing protein n=1 Tax=Gopherus agassizii TaxID=38772 RepID=A0A452I234_9SAUR